MRRSTATAMILIALGWPSSAAAQDVTDLEAILQDPVVSTPSGVAATASIAPATSTSITAEELREQGIRTLDEAINFLSLGMETEPSMHGVEIGSRGVLLNADYGTHVLLLVNGLALNEPWNGTAYFERGAGIPFELIDHIEVMLGPASVLYGSNAMLGVINIVTKRAKDYDGVHVVAEGEAAAPIGAGYAVQSPFGGGVGAGYRAGAGYGDEFRLFNRPAEVTVQLDYYRFHGASVEFDNQDYGLDSVTGEPKRFGPGPGTGVWGGKATRSWYTEAPAAYGRLEAGDFTLSARSGWYKRSAPYSDSLVRYFGNFDPPDDYEKDTFLDTELRYHRQVSSTVDLSVRAFWQYNRYEWYVTSSAPEDCSDGAAGGCRHDLRGIGRHGGGEVKAGFSWRDPWHMVTLVGATAQLRHVDSRAVERSELGVSPPVGAIDISDTQGAVFIEHTARPTRWLEGNAGARFDADERFGTALSPRGAVAATVWDGGTVRSIYAEAFRGPSAYELYYTDPLGQVAAPNLGPETTRSIECSFEQRVGAHRFFVGAFRSWWNDMVVAETLTDDEQAAAIASGELRPEATDALQYRNRTRIDSYGFHAAMHLSAVQARLRFDSNVTGAKASARNDGQPGDPLTVTPQLFGNARLAYDLGDPLPTIAIAALVRSRRLADRFYDGGRRSAPTAPPSVDTRFTVSGQVRAIPGLRYRIGIAYSFARFSAYVIGPSQYALDPSSVARLAPVDRLHGFVGLQYDFPL